MIKGYIFDLDGTIYLGDKIIDGASETINFLKSKGHKVVFLTNKSITSRKDIVNKLNNFGINAQLEEVINSNLVTANFLKENLNSEDSVLTIGEQPLIDELEEHNVNITDNPLEAKYVVLAWDRKFNYDKLNAAFQATKNGARVIATNVDRTCPIEDKKEIPDCGAMIGALEGATGKPVDRIMGKPSRYIVEFVIKKTLHMDYSQCYIIGDRLETDIKMANENGIESILVLTGVSDKEMLNYSKYKPTYVMDRVNDIIEFLKS
ncbi:MAG TPA: HAD-IIA family hydrolase [Bacillota bacterium]|nr:HAD-IIA family hydrolase [Bacillota bacterium]